MKLLILSAAIFLSVVYSKEITKAYHTSKTIYSNVMEVLNEYTHIK